MKTKLLIFLALALSLIASDPHFSLAALFSEGSAPSTPASGQVAVYAKTDGKLYRKDDAGTEGILAGNSSMWIGAAKWVPTTSDGAGVDSIQTGTYNNNYDLLTFDPAAANEQAQYTCTMPDDYSGGTVTATFYWTAASGSGTVIWGCSATTLSNAASIDQARGTEEQVTDALSGADEMQISPETDPITIGGSPAAHVPIIFTIIRQAGTDTLGVDAQLIGVEINY